MSVFTVPSSYYFLFGRMYIIADRPDTEELKNKCPHLPVATLEELEAVKTESEADALLKKAIESL
jgi:hypothetical protein